MRDTTGTTPAEVELRRRLGGLAATATVDDQAWERIQDRIAARQRRGWRPPPRRLLAAAAIVVAITSVIVARRQQHERVDTTDGTSTTVEEPVGTTTTTTDEHDDVTSPTTPDDDRPRPRTGPASAPTDPAIPGGSGAPGRAAGAPGSSPGPSSPSGPASTPGGAPPPTSPPPTTTPPSPGTTMPDGQTPSVTFAAPGYVLQATFWEPYEGAPLHMNIWRPDRGYLTYWTRDQQPGQDCLAGESEFSFDFPEPGTHAYSWGMVRADAAQVRIVATSGESTTAVIGSESVPGLRPWIGKSPPGEVDRYEALDATGTVLHVAARSAGFDAYPDRC